MEKLHFEFSLMQQLAVALPSRVRLDEFNSHALKWTMSVYGWSSYHGIGYQWMPISIRKTDHINGWQWGYVTDVIEEAINCIEARWFIEDGKVYLAAGNNEMIDAARIDKFYPFHGLNINAALVEAFSVAMVLRPNWQHAINFQTQKLIDNRNVRQWYDGVTYSGGMKC